MQMNKNILRVIIGFFIVIILVSAFLITRDPSQNVKPVKTSIFYPLFTDLEETTYENDTIWNVVNASSEMNKTFYITDSKITDIIEWYENKANIGKYKILDGGSSGISTTNIDPNNVSYGYVKLHKNNKTEGLFVFVIKSLERINLEKENLMGIATGPWNVIKTCEKIGNFTSLK